MSTDRYRGDAADTDDTEAKDASPIDIRGFVPWDCIQPLQAVLAQLQLEPVAALSELIASYLAANLRWKKVRNIAGLCRICFERVLDSAGCHDLLMATCFTASFRSRHRNIRQRATSQMRGVPSSWPHRSMSACSARNTYHRPGMQHRSGSLRPFRCWSDVTFGALH